MSRDLVPGLRHSCATLSYELGLSIENIQDVLRDSTSVTTNLLYMAGPEKVHREAAVRLGDLVDAGGLGPDREMPAAPVNPARPGVDRFLIRRVWRAR